MKLDFEYLESLEEYLKSGTLEDHFQWSPKERRIEMLEFLDKIMDLSEIADEVATKLIFKGSLGTLAGIKEDKED